MILCTANCLILYALDQELIFLDRIYRIFWISFFIFSFQMKLKMYNRLRRIKMEITKYY